MKAIIRFFVWLWRLLFPYAKEEEKTVVKKTVDEKIESTRRRKPRGIPIHNNRSSKRNKRGARSRFTQYTPSGKAIFHTTIKSPSV